MTAKLGEVAKASSVLQTTEEALAGGDAAADNKQVTMTEPTVAPTESTQKVSLRMSLVQVKGKREGGLGQGKQCVSGYLERVIDGV